MAQLSPIHSWKLIFPWEVSAVKFGASSLMRSMCWSPDLIESKRGFVRELSRNDGKKSNLLRERNVNSWQTVPTSIASRIGRLNPALRSFGALQAPQDDKSRWQGQNER